jgi:hypothetical protein
VSPRAVITAALLVSFSCGASQSAVTQVPWVTGFWYVTSDNGNDSALNQVMEFRQDGSFILYDIDCDPLNSPEESAYQLVGDDIYVTSIHPSVNPASLAIHADMGRRVLAFTYPDLNTLVTIERTPGNKCFKQR